MTSGQPIATKNQAKHPTNTTSTAQPQIGSQTGTQIPVSINISDLGFEHVTGEVLLDVVGSSGEVLWSGSQLFGQPGVLRQAET